MVEDAERMVDVEKVAAHVAAGAQGGAKQWWHGSTVDIGGDASRTK